MDPIWDQNQDISRALFLQETLGEILFISQLLPAFLASWPLHSNWPLFLSSYLFSGFDPPAFH